MLKNLKNVADHVGVGWIEYVHTDVELAIETQIARKRYSEEGTKIEALIVSATWSNGTSTPFWSWLVRLSLLLVFELTLWFRSQKQGKRRQESQGKSPYLSYSKLFKDGINGGLKSIERGGLIHGKLLAISGFWIFS